MVVIDYSVKFWFCLFLIVAKYESDLLLFGGRFGSPSVLFAGLSPTQLSYLLGAYISVHVNGIGGQTLFEKKKLSTRHILLR